LDLPVADGANEILDPVILIAAEQTRTIQRIDVHTRLALKRQQFSLSPARAKTLDHTIRATAFVNNLDTGRAGFIGFPAYKHGANLARDTQFSKSSFVIC
jgi:hypothetical protein